MELGLLLTLPIESVAVRAIFASVVGVLLLRGLLRLGVRSVGARIAMALAPAAALLTVVVWSWRGGGLQLPSLMLPVEAADALPIPVTDGYVHFAPSAAPFLVALWAVVVAALLIRRARAHARGRQACRLALAGEPPPSELVATVTALAEQHRVTVPRVAVTDRCPGGAFVVGTRRPVLVLGRDLLDRLDEEELEGVLAHELAHIRRRDNLVATALGVVRDVAFFVPGGRWAITQLHRERERAADHAAVGVTGRPGALASGLLKSLDVPGPSHPCAALAPSQTLVDRVTELVDGPAPVSRLRGGAELAIVAGVALVAVIGAVAVPSLFAGEERQRDALAVAWTPAPGSGGSAAAGTASEARAFEVYRATRLEIDRPAVVRSGPDTSSVENRPGTWRACGDGPSSGCPTSEQGVGLGLRPRSPIMLDDRLPWQATPAFPTGGAADGLHLPSIYWLQRVG